MTSGSLVEPLDLHYLTRKGWLHVNIVNETSYKHHIQASVMHFFYTSSCVICVFPIVGRCSLVRAFSPRFLFVYLKITIIVCLKKTESLSSYKKYWLFKAFRPFQSFISKYPSSLSKPSELSLYGQSDMSAVGCPQL